MLKELYYLIINIKNKRITNQTLPNKGELGLCENHETC